MLKSIKICVQDWISYIYTKASYVSLDEYLKNIDNYKVPINITRYKSAREISKLLKRDNINEIVKLYKCDNLDEYMDIVHNIHHKTKRL